MRHAPRHDGRDVGVGASGGRDVGWPGGRATGRSVAAPVGARTARGAVGHHRGRDHPLARPPRGARRPVTGGRARCPRARREHAVRARPARRSAAGRRRRTGGGLDSTAIEASRRRRRSAGAKGFVAGPGSGSQQTRRSAAAPLSARTGARQPAHTKSPTGARARHPLTGGKGSAPRDQWQGLGDPSPTAGLTVPTDRRAHRPNRRQGSAPQPTAGLTAPTTTPWASSPSSGASRSRGRGATGGRGPRIPRRGGRGPRSAR